MKEQVSRIAKQPNFSSILTAEDKLVVIGGGNSDDFIDDLKVLIVDLSGDLQSCVAIPDSPLGEIGVSAAFMANKYILACGGGWTTWDDPFGTNKCFALIVSVSLFLKQIKYSRLTFQDNIWTDHTPMEDIRLFPATIMVNDNEWVIGGGWAGQ